MKRFMGAFALAATQQDEIFHHDAPLLLEKFMQPQPQSTDEDIPAKGDPSGSEDASPAKGDYSQSELSSTKEEGRPSTKKESPAKGDDTPTKGDPRQSELSSTKKESAAKGDSATTGEDFPKKGDPSKNKDFPQNEKSPKKDATTSVALAATPKSKQNAVSSNVAGSNKDVGSEKAPASNAKGMIIGALLIGALLPIGAQLIASAFLGRGPVIGNQRAVQINAESIRMQRTNVQLDNVHVAEETKEDLRNIVDTQRWFPHFFEGTNPLPPTNSVLLVGPPGTGKTFLAEAVANYCGYYCAKVDPTIVVDSLLGESPKRMKQVFETVRAKAPAVVFIDELDFFFNSRKGLGGGSADSPLGTFLTEVSGATPSDKKILIIAATNRPEDLDDAVKSRFRTIHVGLPTSEFRKKIVIDNLQGVVLPGENPEDIATGFDERITLKDEISGRDLKDIVTLARQRRVRELHTASVWKRVDRESRELSSAADNYGWVPATSEESRNQSATVLRKRAREMTVAERTRVLPATISLGDLEDALNEFRESKTDEPAVLVVDS